MNLVIPFDFGQNWKEYSENVLDKTKFNEARLAFDELTKGISFTGKTFVDIGFGQGMSLLIATEKAAKTVGCDINSKCDEVLKTNQKIFKKSTDTIPTVVGSILETEVVDAIRAKNDGKQYDIVHSWGVLHHTGNMMKAIQNTASLVKPDGYLVLAIYNRHWSSLLWLFIKWAYCQSPKLIQILFIGIFYPIIWLAKFLVTGKSPNIKERGMDFYYDVVDWVGGYPYEYASISEMNKIMQNLGFTCVKSVSASTPTGCNEFVYQKTI
jgi:2-polyprenyl-6-hydroxyphenyl methylase/3-demethylubiquinone-9 3-methyltransferase